MKKFLCVLWISALALTFACSNDGNSKNEEISQRENVVSRIKMCSADYCKTHPGKGCDKLLRGQEASLFNPGNTISSRMSQKDIEELSGASCDKIVQRVQSMESNDTAPGRVAPKANLLSSTNKRVEVEVEISDVGIVQEIRNGVSYSRLRLANSATLAQVGPPALPQYSFMLDLPDGTGSAKVVDFKIIKQKTFEGIDIMPAQKPLRENETPGAFAVNSERYALSSNYPGETYKLDPIMTWRSHKVVRGTVFPFQFNARGKRLVVAARFKITVEFANQTGARLTRKSDPAERIYAPLYNVMLNYNAIGQRAAMDGNIEYLVIVKDSFLSTVQPLIDL